MEIVVGYATGAHGLTPKMHDEMSWKQSWRILSGSKFYLTKLI